MRPNWAAVEVEPNVMTSVVMTPCILLLSPYDTVNADAKMKNSRFKTQCRNWNSSARTALGDRVHIQASWRVLAIRATAC